MVYQNYFFTGFAFKSLKYKQQAYFVNADKVLRNRCNRKKEGKSMGLLQFFKNYFRDIKAQNENIKELKKLNKERYGTDI